MLTLPTSLFTFRKIPLAAVSFMSLASIAAAAAPHVETNPFERSTFSDDWEVLNNDIFFGGVEALFGLSPASRTPRLLEATEPKTTSESYAIVNAAGSSENLFSFAFSSGSPFGIGRGRGGIAPNAITANTANNYIGAPAGSLLTTGNWSLGHVPTVSEDAVFTATTGIRTLSAGNLTVGSFNVTATSSTFSIRNETSTATNSTLTLGGSGSTGNSVSGNAADLLYANIGSTFNIIGPNGGGGSGVLNIVLGQSGNFNAAGTITISSVISDGGSGFGITKTGAGTLTLSGANTYSGGTTVSAGLLQLNNSSALGSSSGSLTVNGGVLNLNDQSVTVGNLTGSGGTIWNNLATQAVTLTIGNGNNGGGNYAGVIADRNIGGGTGTGTVALTKTGTGTITLSGANTYTGATTVNGGTLLVTGSTASGSAVTVNNSGTLGGTGTVSGTVQVNSGGTLSPGTSPGTLTTGAVTLANGSMFAVDLTAGSGNDLLVAPSVTLGTILTGPSLSLNITGTLAMGQQFFIVSNTGANAVSGVFAQGATITSGGYTFLIDYLADFGTQSAVGGNDIMLEVTAVPEPSTWVGAALALAAIGFTQRRRLRGLIARGA